MKKTLYVLLLVLSMITLAGCQDVIADDPTPEIKDSFSVELIDLDGTKLIDQSIEFDEASTKTTLELIETKIEVDYQTFDFGVMINGVGGHYPKEYGTSYNYFYQIQVDGMPSEVGIGDINYKKDMTISFVEVSTLSALDQNVDDFIYSFINDHLSSYLSNDGSDYMVAAAVEQLIRSGYTTIALSDYYTYNNLLLGEVNVANSTLTDLTVAELLKIGTFRSIEGVDLNTYKTHLLTLDETSPYALTSYLEALYFTGEQDIDAAKLLIGQIPSDPDLAGMSLLALSSYGELEGFDTYLSSTLDYIKTTLTSTGVSSWGTSNAASTAAIILGLVAQGINPQDEAYQTNEVGLIEALMLYALDDGFKYSMDATEIDDAFSTPQAFSALVAYKLSRDVWGFPKTNILDLNQA